MRDSEDSEFSYVVSISLAIKVCLLEFLLISTSIPHIRKVKYRTNAKKSKYFFSKYYLMTLHLELLKTYIHEEKENGTEINLMK